jgi:outer membrane protein TolC
MTRHCLFLVLMLLGGPAAIAAQQTSDRAPVLTLDAAVQAAIAGNRQLQSSALDVTKADDAAAAARALRLPQFNAQVLAGIALTPINFTIPAGTLGTYPGLGPLPSADSKITTRRGMAGVIQASFTQPLSQLFKINLGVRQAQIGHDAAAAADRQARLETVARVKQTYAQLAELQSEMESADAAIKELTELSALTERRLAEQAVLKVDDLTVKARLGQARYQKVKFMNAYDAGRDTLNRLLGRDLAEAFSVERLPPPAPGELDLAAAEARATERRPELQRAKLQITKADLDVRRVHAENIPDVGVQVSVLSFANVKFLPPAIAQLGFAVEWQPFDFTRPRRAAEMQVARQQADLALKDAEADVRADVRDGFRRLAEARALIDAAGLMRDSDREKLRVLMDRYNQNAALLADVLQAQSAAADSDAGYERALAAFWSTRANFERAIGEGL